MSTPEKRLKMAARIVDFEARRDTQGRIQVYTLPRGDGGGQYEVAGINERYHPAEAAALRALVESGQQQEAERRAGRYVASYTDAGDRWTPYDAVESYLRDCIFNRGPGGAATIYQIALGVTTDGDVGPLTRAAGEQADPHDLLDKLRTAREHYERRRRDESSPFWKGLVKRWNESLAFARGFLPAEPDENSAPAEPPASQPLQIRELHPPLPSRSRTVQPSLVVLHATAGASAQSSIDHLRGAGLSYHYIIARDARDAKWTKESDGSQSLIFHCVEDSRQAFHVGSTIPAPSGEGSINKCSIGVSLANLQTNEAYTPAQLVALRSLLLHLKQTHPSLRHLTKHALVQPWNREDPLHVDAEALARECGYELWVPGEEVVKEHRPR